MTSVIRSQLVFAYGSNMDPAQMRERCPESDLSWFVAEARGWKLCFPRRSIGRRGGVGSIIRADGASVWGVVFTVSERDLSRLDGYEGVPNAYTRGPIDLFCADGRPVSALTYFAVAQGSEVYTPHRDYIDLYLKGAEYYGLPEKYIEGLRGIQTKRD